jgi:GTP cyclohydrolase II
MERGLLLYLRQEGRGIGLRNKVRAYALQDRGLDTVEANRALGFRDDERDYGVAAHMIASLNVKSVRLMTNNPNKIQQLEKNGIKVSGRIPHVMPVNEFNRFYLQTKAVRSGHYLEIDGKEVLIEQDDPPVVESGQAT